MSKWGRAQDYIYETLYGYEVDEVGTFHEGPLFHLGRVPVTKIADDILENVSRILEK